MTTAEGRVGVTLPFDDVPLAGHRPLLRALVEAGYREVWTGEVDALDGFGPLALFCGREDALTISCATASVFTRGPGVLAMTAATLAEVAPGACRFGIGAGSPVLAETWNGVPFEAPYRRTVDAFRLSRTVDGPPKLLLGVAGPRMQDFAAAEADTMALNFLSPEDVARIRDRVSTVERVLPTPLETAVRVVLLPREGPGAERAARPFLAGYLTVPTYAAFQRWLGREAVLGPMNAAWAAGDRRAAVAAIPDEVLHDLVVFGSSANCAASVERYLERGADVVTIALVPDPDAEAPEARVEFLAALTQASGVARSKGTLAS
ncbi:LLM class flavin-dependent oxidoreductase [Nocardioides sp.]|uniref:LLM class flavin-dependent oxidoreductase n=1 Tax=Nocardioides sp. TaxID=35761 RepID=UPI0026200E63|nr:LLM class flavin-dependent oxidoreductase [Nocardioides sp.]MDI6910588.1 LLM class flavin-dependent oxidoreductase [Nocardioides sp.]